MTTVRRLVACAALGWAAAAAAADRTVVDFDPGFRIVEVETDGALVNLAPPAAGRPGSLRVYCRLESEFPGFTLRPREVCWDLSDADAVAMDVRNLTARPLTIGWRLDNLRGDGNRDGQQETFPVPADGTWTTVAMRLRRRLPEAYGLFGMNGYPGRGAYTPGDHNLDPARVIRMTVFALDPAVTHVFEVARIRATGDPPPLPPPATFFPFIDAYGQYVHADWPGKIRSDADLAARRAEEAADLAAHPAPPDRDRWGGWSAGPQLRGTGHFRPEKRNGRWWLVDPDGRLFFSHGIDGVGQPVATPVTDRDRWFAAVPCTATAFAAACAEGTSGADRRYDGRRVTFADFGAADAMRKYGTAWRDSAVELAHRRLASWGMNTIGNWSAEAACLSRRTPYTVAIHYRAPWIAGSPGHAGFFPDVFDPGFRRAVRERLAGEQGRSADDPWCLGYFVDNELSWGMEDRSLGEAVLASPPDQPAKVRFVGELRTRFREVSALNRAWGSLYASWDALAASRTPPGGKACAADLAAFGAEIADRYFRECRDAVKAVAPRTLYLGCRFAGWRDFAVAAAAKRCDVLSFNLYWREVSGFTPPGGADAPVLIGEFHCGALDRGLFHPGLQAAPDQAGRAAFYRAYVESAARNRFVVGCHWFQYADEPTTGRFDGENYQIGFVDVCDTPYPETIAAARDVGARLYDLRRGP